MIKNIGANWLQLLVSIAVAYYLTPFTLHTLGREPYGTWLLITSITGYLSLLVLGLPMASVRFVARHAHGKDPVELNRAVSNCLGLSIVFAFAAILAGGLAFAFFSTYDIPAASWSDARLAFGIVVLNTALGFVGQVPTSILAAHEDFVTQNKILIASLLLRFAFIVALLRYQPTFVVLAVALSLSMLFEATASTLVIRARYPAIRPSFRQINWLTTRSIVSFSVFVLILGVGSQLSFQTDAIVIGKMLTVDVIPYFTTASIIPLYLMQLVIGIAAVVMPTAARLHAEHGVAPLGVLLLKWSKIALSLTLFVALFLIAVGPQFLAWWLGPEFAGPGGAVLRILIVSSIVFLPARGVAIPIMMGIGNPRWPAIGFVATGLLNLLLSVLLARPLGVAGVALATAVPNIIFAMLLIRVVCRDLQVSGRRYFMYVVWKPLVGSLPVLGAVALSTLAWNVATFGGLLLSAVVLAIVYAPTWLFYVYKDDAFVSISRLATLRPFRAS